jgi:hypothetical protein
MGLSLMLASISHPSGRQEVGDAGGGAGETSWQSRTNATVGLKRNVYWYRDSSVRQ